MSEQSSLGLTSKEYWSLSGFTVACVMLVVINISYTQGNRELKQQVTQRQLFIGQTVQLEKIQKKVINVIAQMAVRDNDDALRKLLTDQGIEIRMNNAPLPE